MADITFRYDRAPTGELSGESLVEQTEQALSELGAESSQAEERAEEAIRIATDADAKSDQAVSTATSAQETANGALTTAQSAQSSATQAVQTAQSAVTTAQGATQTAQNAVSAATSAQTAAERAQTAAENAESSASTAASAAGSSASSASAAQTAAESAQTSAGQSATIATQAQQAAAQSAQNAQAAAAAVGASARQIGEIITSSLPLTTAGLHLLDGALLDGNGIYADFVDYIAGLYTADPTAAYFTDENSWQSSVTTYGVCGKFVYDSINETVRLPKITGITEGTTDLTALGDLVEAGLPNVTGDFESDVNGTGWLVFGGANSAFYLDGSQPNNAMNATSTGATSGDRKNRVSIDASRSSPIYGNSTTVQPQTIKTLVYIVVATVTKTEIQVDIDNVVTELNRLDSVVSHVAPVGSYIYYAGGSVPDHYLLCNGAAVSRSEYADLFNIIGTTYGSGDGSTTFNLPNLIDKFIEGSGTSGTVKNAGLPNITGYITTSADRCDFWGAQGYGGALDRYYNDTTHYPLDSSSSQFIAPAGFKIDASTSNAIYGGSNTVQPPALTALPCIRYE